MVADPSRLSDLQAAQFLIRHDMLPFLTIRNTVCRKSVGNIETPLLVLLAEQGQLDLDDVRARLTRDAIEPAPPPRRRRELNVPRPPPRPHAPPPAPPAPSRSNAAENEQPPGGAANRDVAGLRDLARRWPLRVAGIVACLAALVVAAMRALWG